MGLRDCKESRVLDGCGNMRLLWSSVNVELKDCKPLKIKGFV